MGTYYNVKEFGALGNGRENDQQALQRAIDLCHERGGGTVLLEGGVYRSGTLYLKSNVYLEVDVSARLEAWGDIECYGEDTHYNRYRNEPELDRCWIYAQDAENIGITGYGELNGRFIFPMSD